MHTKRTGIRISSRRCGYRQGIVIVNRKPRGVVYPQKGASLGRVGINQNVSTTLFFAPRVYLVVPSQFNFNGHPSNPYKAINFLARQCPSTDEDSENTITHHLSVETHACGVAQRAVRSCSCVFGRHGMCMSRGVDGCTKFRLAYQAQDERG